MEFYGKKFVLKYIDRTIGTNIEGLDAELNTKPEEVSSK
jgi:hypothetical protein